MASCQGSMSSRASAETTLSCIPLPSSPIVANRKSLNSDSSREAERVISITGFYRFCRRLRTAATRWTLQPIYRTQTVLRGIAPLRAFEAPQADQLSPPLDGAGNCSSGGVRYERTLNGAGEV